MKYRVPKKSVKEYFTYDKGSDRRQARPEGWAVVYTLRGDAERLQSAYVDSVHKSEGQANARYKELGRHPRGTNLYGRDDIDVGWIIPIVSLSPQ